jgi:hypothetical protein
MPPFKAIAEQSVFKYWFCAPHCVFHSGQLRWKGEVSHPDIARSPVKRPCVSSSAIVGLVVAALGLVSAATVLAANSATTIRYGNLVVRLEGVLSPRALPKTETAPVSFHASASVSTANGSHVPPALSAELQVDKHISIDTTGLPTCAPGRIEASSPSEAMRACGSALIGRGSAGAQVEFPESLPFVAKGPLLAFNGPSVGGGYGGHGYNEQLYYIYVAVPAPTAVVVVAKLSKDTGRYAYRISVAVPSIAGGSGSLTSVQFTIDRSWPYGGRQYSYLNAECPDGHFFNQVEVAYGNGTDLKGDVVNSCHPKG